MKKFAVYVILVLSFLSAAVFRVSALDIYIDNAYFTTALPATYNPTNPPTLSGKVSVRNTTTSTKYFFITVQEALDQRLAFLTVNNVLDTLLVNVRNSTGYNILPIESITTVTTSNTIKSSVGKNRAKEFSFSARASYYDYGMGGTYQGSFTFVCYLGTTKANGVLMNTWSVPFSYTLPIRAEANLSDGLLDFDILEDGETLSTTMTFTATRAFDMYVQSTNGNKMTNPLYPEAYISYSATFDGTPLGSLASPTVCLTIESWELSGLPSYAPDFEITISEDIPWEADPVVYSDTLMFTVVTR